MEDSNEKDENSRIEPLMQIVRARSEDAAELTRIAHAAKRHWGYPEPWIARWKDLLTLSPEFIQANGAFAAIVESEIVGFYGVMPVPDAVRLEHLWVLPSRMRKGVGRALFTHAVDRARRSGFRTMEIEADPNAAGFYEKMGCVRAGANIGLQEGITRELPVFHFDLRE